MRFSLQDIKKQVHRRGGELTVSLHFLRPGELRKEIAQLITYHERLLGQPQRQFSQDDARACIGDYRVAHCLVATLSAWYRWLACDWDEVVEHMGSSALNEAGITSPVQLRLALFDEVNEQCAGFLDAQSRAETLTRFANRYQLTLNQLEYLLRLDSDEEALLTREGSEPMPNEVAALYNQWAFEAALFAASEAHFVIDTNAFLRAQNEQGGSTLTGVGAAIKRLCFLARKLGVYYDLAYDTAPDLLHLTLYGPQEMTGAPQQYGLRLVRLCRMLLNYGQHHQSKLSLSAIVKAEATVHFLQRSYRFVMDDALLKLLPRGEEAVGSQAGQGEYNQTVFDSSIEQSFAEAFSALAKHGQAEGWQLEREPEPILLATAGSSSLMIPDFALSRDAHRIYLEILGFWTPSYRERKIAKLQALKDRGDMLLALPVEARGAFESLAAHFPMIVYDGQISVSEVLWTLRQHVNDFEERLARVNFEQVRQRVQQQGWLSEQACFDALHCYRRAELAEAAERVRNNTTEIVFTPGIGLYMRAWLEHLGRSFVEWLEMAGGVLPLAEAFQEMRRRWPMLAGCEDAALETLVSLWPAIHVLRSSIFDARVELAEMQPTSVDVEEMARQRVQKTTVRERRAFYKRRTTEGQGTSPAVQQDLWG